MPVDVNPKALQALEKARAAAAEKKEEKGKKDIAPGTKCVRHGCPTVYKDESSYDTVCVHHPGTAVFHETYKYWSCCDKNRTYDFDDFRKIVGCRKGPETCCFTEEEAGIVRVPCRHDFFQVGPAVTVNIYAKKVDPEQSTFMVSKDELRVNVHFDPGKKERKHVE
eukprot:Sspe_Gene.83060::Locus_54486_Transcript_1_1_Confidence_1.000_Length_704::g.83060::m.83060/K16729/CHORDC1, CHP1; cysteine and histidine-rich domain-containing protein 1